MNKNEIIFCLLRAELETLFVTPIPQGGFIKPDLEQIFSLPQHFLRRGDAEHDPAYKQIIPYQLFSCRDKFFVYQRGSGVGEGRLAGRLSLGIGGHINTEDADRNHLTIETYNNALLREREEELICKDNFITSFAGWINDDSDLVGQVHLGAVHCCEVHDEKSLKIREHGEDIHSCGWWQAHKIKDQKQKFEKWSLLALGLAYSINATLQ